MNWALRLKQPPINPDSPVSDKEANKAKEGPVLYTNDYEDKGSISVAAHPEHLEIAGFRHGPNFYRMAKPQPVSEAPRIAKQWHEHKDAQDRWDEWADRH